MTDERFLTRTEAVVSVLRDITRGALAGLIVGVAVLGIGGRIVMRLAAIIDPTSVGRLTENGNRIGDVTLGGTVTLVFFGGILVGLATAVVWIAIQEWIPGRSLARAIVCMPIAVALTGFQLVRPENPDFRILAPAAPVLALLLGLVAIAGFAFAIVADWLGRRLPPPATRLSLSVAAYVVVLVAGLPFVVLAARIFLEPHNAVRDTPVASGVALAAAGAVTVVAWLVRIVSRRVQPPRVLRSIGGGTLAVAVVVGGWLLADQVAQVISLGS
jgi:hypothetical protein